MTYLARRSWRPQKPKVGLSVLEKVLNRHTVMSCPESRLVVSVISIAIVDCLCLDNHLLRREARKFVLGHDIETWCEWVGLEPWFVRSLASNAGYLAEEPEHLRSRA